MPHVFISYVREDYEAVERLFTSLRANGIRTWIDRNDIRPGARWKRSIRKAISDGDFFIACFSPNYVQRTSTYMNEELTIAIELLRQMPADRAWFIPVLLSECEVPDRDIGSGETLLDIQQVRLYRNWDTGINQILSVIKPIQTSSAEASTETNDDKISILFLGANPTESSRIRVDEELRAIQSGIMESEFRHRFDLANRVVVRLVDLQRALLLVSPRIVHFSGHGTRSGKLMLQAKRGKSAEVSAEALTSLFEMAPSKVECVVLNCPYSSKLARTIARRVKYVIGMSHRLTNKAAITFSAAFYRALANGQSIELAFKLACTEIKLAHATGMDFPVLVMNGG